MPSTQKLCLNSLPRKAKTMCLISQNASAPPRSMVAGANEPKPDSSALKKSERKRSRDERQWKKPEREEEMQRLEGVLFGSIQAPPGSTPIFDDRSPDIQQHLLSREPAWIDEAEEKIQVDISKVSRLRKLRKNIDEDVISGVEYVRRLRAQHMKLNPGTNWAWFGLDPLANDEDDHYLFATTDELVVRDNRNPLEVSRLSNVNKVDRSNSVIKSVQFHPNGQLMFTAGPDCGLKLFQVDGKRNPKVDSISLEDFPIYKASFMPDGFQLIMAGRRKFFYTYDLEKNHVNRAGPLIGRDEKSLESFEVSPDSKTIAFFGNEGHILLVSSKTKQLIGTLKMNGTLRSLAFAENGTQILTAGGDGCLYHWDIGTRKCMHVGVDEGSIGVTCLCVSPDSSLFCTGSRSGIVNLYERDKFLGGKKKPLKTFKHFTTEVNEMKFSPNAQSLAICSERMNDAVRLVHVPSCSIVSNWQRHNLGHVRCMDFSPNSNLLTAGNAEGDAFLWEINYGA